jgi:ferric-dicitrate binding protein FerR (iron transport regulator)
MPATFVPISPDALSGLQHGDEHALERIFRDEYPALMERAAADAGDPAVAARVVEDAFVDAWQARARFESPQALEEFLHKAVHVHAVRERSRREAIQRLHQFEVGRGPVAAPPAPQSVEEAWSHVAATLHAPPPDADRAAHLRADHARHEAASHVAQVVEKKSWALPIALGALALSLIALGGWWLDRAGREARVDNAFSSADLRTLATGSGQRATVTLLDGSTALLGADSKVIVPPSFGDIRAVKLEGNASFSVVPDPANPFVVRAGPAKITVTGSVLDVTAPTEGVVGPVVVRMREGRAVLQVEESTRTLETGATAAIAPDGTISEPSPVELEEALGWIDGRFVVENRPLREVIPMLRRWYKLQILVPDSSLLAKSASVRVSLDSTQAALEAVERSAGVDIRYERKLLVLRPATDSAAAAPAKTR